MTSPAGPLIRLTYASGTPSQNPDPDKTPTYSQVKTPDPRYQLPATIYPFLQQYLNAMDSEVTTASTLVILPWSFKVFYSILSDCVPLWGYRRKVWMLVGWAMCLTMLIVMAASPAGDPYYTVPSDRGIDPADYTPEIEARINFDAGSQAGKYVMLMLFAAIGYVLVDVCADSIVVEYA
ncbi:hypothetical protein L916_02203 [Phytophthora nicotianae]|uniref:Uncharacterized protein n=2 Tax=Phytophthora nicotianae TaxID=4792 RepID=W2JP23_PHYNI|nr:hypothetical protein L916_02203 [Phytophthora nicotianae]